MNDLFSKNEKNNEPEWFEEVYSKVKQGELEAPWALNEANAHVLEFFNNNSLETKSKKALKVGCGLGDDSEFLSTLQYEVTAFDISKSAIEICKDRFKSTKVNYEVNDLIEPPKDYLNKFDFILELYTLQSLPPKFVEKAQKNIATFLAKNGRLIVIAQSLEENEERPSVPPYAFTKKEMDRFVSLGLTEISSKVVFDKIRQRNLFVIEYTK